MSEWAGQLADPMLAAMAPWVSVPRSVLEHAILSALDQLEIHLVRESEAILGGKVYRVEHQRGFYNLVPTEGQERADESGR